MMDKPNIVYLLADQIRAYSLPIYGEKQIDTPHIDQLAQRRHGLFKRNCHSTCMHPLPLYATHRTTPANNRSPHQFR